MTVTLLIAICGAVVSTALAIRTIWRDRFEDGRLALCARMFTARLIAPTDGQARFTG